MPLKSLLRRLWPQRDDTAFHVYGAIVAQARRPEFYRDLGIADTVDGRFDMIVLHAFILFHRLKDVPEEAALGQRVFDAMFLDMDRSLREMGAGDLGVPKKIRRMGEAFYGRARAYDAALAGEGEDSLEAAVARNLFPGEEEGTATGTQTAEQHIAAQHIAAQRIADYVRASVAGLAKQPFAEIADAHIAFADPAVFVAPS